jgi:hypothetical protein
MLLGKNLGQFMLLGKNIWAVYSVGENCLGRNYALSFSPNGINSAPKPKNKKLCRPPPPKWEHLEEYTPLRFGRKGGKEERKKENA